MFLTFDPYGLSIIDFSSSMAAWRAYTILAWSLNFLEFSLSLLNAGNKNIAIRANNPKAIIVSIRVNPNFLFFVPNITQIHPYFKFYQLFFISPIWHTYFYGTRICNIPIFIKFNFIFRHIIIIKVNII